MGRAEQKIVDKRELKELESGRVCLSVLGKFRSEIQLCKRPLKPRTTRWKRNEIGCHLLPGAFSQYRTFFNLYSPFSIFNLRDLYHTRSTVLDTLGCGDVKFT